MSHHTMFEVHKRMPEESDPGRYHGQGWVPA